MSLRQKYLDILSVILPTGALGVSIMLASAAPGDAREHPAGAEPKAAESPGVSERLSAIRDAVSAVVDSESEAAKSRGGQSGEGERVLAWGNWGNGWNNFGWRNGGWNNWSNWNNWHNHWHNWANFWNNW